MEANWLRRRRRTLRSVVIIIRFYIVAILLLRSTNTASSERPTVPKDIIKILQNEAFYDRHALPYQSKGYPTNVTISMYIEGLSSFQASTMGQCTEGVGTSAVLEGTKISSSYTCRKSTEMQSDSATAMDFHVDIYFQERWVDHRLSHNSSQRVLIKDPKIYDQMWHPDLYFANARSSDFHYVTAPNFFLYVYPNGTVYYDTRISLTVMCMMNLFKYPLDRQTCDIRILSYAYDEEQLKISWIDERPIENNDIKLADMELEEITTGDCNGTYAIGTWSCITARFVVRREIMHHILQSYIPTALIVIISWFSFWLDVDSVPGRVSLCITTLLTLATQASAARLALPQVSYIKAIDVWMGTCLAFVFGVMIEFTLVNYWSRRKPSFAKLISMHGKQSSKDILQRSVKRRARTLNGILSETHLDTAHSDSELQTPSDGQVPYLRTNNRWEERDDERRMDRMRAIFRQKNRRTAIAIDRKCRVLFPLAFLIFNLIYWPYYLYFVV